METRNEYISSAIGDFFSRNWVWVIIAIVLVIAIFRYVANDSKQESPQLTQSTQAYSSTVTNAPLANEVYSGTTNGVSSTQNGILKMTSDELCARVLKNGIEVENSLSRTDFILKGHAGVSGRNADNELTVCVYTSDTHLFVMCIFEESELNLIAKLQLGEQIDVAGVYAGCVEGHPVMSQCYLY